MSTRMTDRKTDARGAKCRFCSKRMLDWRVKGCLQSLVTLKDGRKFQPKPYDGTWDNGEGRCPDCGAHTGFAHHPGCDVERCAVPDCARQAISCEHMADALTHVRVVPQGVN
jgi:hypothetical protein